MAPGERLHEKGAVGIAVEIDARNVQRGENRRHVVGRDAGTEKVRRLAELRAAGGDLMQLHQRRALEQRTVDDAGRAGSAVVDDQQIAGRQQRRIQAAIERARSDRRISRAAFDRDDRAGRTPARVGVRKPGERDVDRSRHLPRRIERTAQRSAIVVAFGKARFEVQGAGHPFGGCAAREPCREPACVGTRLAFEHAASATVDASAATRASERHVALSTRQRLKSSLAMPN